MHKKPEQPKTAATTVNIADVVDDLGPELEAYENGGMAAYLQAVFKDNPAVLAFANFDPKKLGDFK